MQSLYDYPGFDVYRPGWEPKPGIPREPTYATRDKGPDMLPPEFECTQEQAERIARLPNGLGLLASLASNPRYQLARAITPRL